MSKKITKKEFKAEAIRRMEILNLNPYIVDKFKNEGKLICSQVYHPYAYFSDLSPEVEDKVKWLEKTKQGMVYHVTQTNATRYGEPVEMYNLLYISPYREDWEVDEQFFQNNLAFCYVWNKSWDDGSEFGTIQYTNIGGALLRTA